MGKEDRVERGIFSKEILDVINKNLKVFLFSFGILFLGLLWKIVAYPQEYRAISYFRYMGDEPGELTVKKDNNGTVTLIQYRIGEENLDIQTLFKSPDFLSIKGENRVNLTFDRGNGNHVLEVRGVDKQEILEISEIYMDKILEKNTQFLQEKILRERDREKKEMLILGLEDSGRNFPLFIKAENVERIDSRKDIYLFFAFFTTVFVSIIIAFIAQVLREVRGNK